MKKLISLLLALVMMFALTACGGPDMQPTIDKFNETADVFAEVATAINADPSIVPEEGIDFMIELSGALEEHRALLESGEELPEEQLAEMNAWYDQVQERLAAIKAELGL